MSRLLSGMLVTFCGGLLVSGDFVHIARFGARHQRVGKRMLDIVSRVKLWMSPPYTNSP